MDTEYAGLWGAEITPIKHYVVISEDEYAYYSGMPLCWRNTYGIGDD